MSGPSRLDRDTGWTSLVVDTPDWPTVHGLVDEWRRRHPDREIEVHERFRDTIMMRREHAQEWFDFVDTYKRLREL